MTHCGVEKERCAEDYIRRLLASSCPSSYDSARRALPAVRTMQPITDVACGVRLVPLVREDAMALCNKVSGEMKVVSGGSTL
eukprot:1328879-Lingulodinium_polyedra.AAC.1